VDRSGGIHKFARTSGLAPQTIDTLLRGTRKPHRSTIAKAANAMGVTPSWLLHGDKEVACASPENRSQPISKILPILSPLGRPSIMGISAFWAESVCGIDPAKDKILAVDADRDLLPDVLAGEPVLIREIRQDEHYQPSPGEILLVARENCALHVIRTNLKGEYEGRLLGTAFLTGQRLQDDRQPPDSEWRRAHFPSVAP
jgi:SOS-response transcriptional repressor LexA